LKKRVRATNGLLDVGIPRDCARKVNVDNQPAATRVGNVLKGGKREDDLRLASWNSPTGKG